jgi:hypothetical protein
MTAYRLAWCTAIAAMISGLLGCAGSPMSVRSESPEELAQHTTERLCRAWHSNRQSGIDIPNLNAELKRRVEIRPEDWDRIRLRDVRVGMSGAAVICSLGTPDREQQVETTTGTYQQWAYEGTISRPDLVVLVYQKNGRVIDWGSR